MDPFFHTGLSISDSLKTVRKSVLIYETIIMDEEKIRKLRQMDWEDFLEERRYRERLEETMQEIDTGNPEDGEPFAMDVRELLDHVGDRRLYEVLKDTEHQTLEILLLSTWGYSIKEIANIMGLPKDTVYTKRKILRKKLKNFKF